MSELFKSSDVVVTNSRYYINFADYRQEQVSLNTFEKGQKNSLDKAQSVADSIIVDAEEKASDILLNAQAQAEEIKKNAQAQAESLKSSVHLEAKNNAEAEFKQQRENIEAAILELNQCKDKLLSNSESELLELSVKIAEKIIQSQLTVSLDSCKTFFESAVDEILRNDYDVIGICLNKKNIEALYPDWEMEKFMINIKHDARLDDFSCIVQTDTGDIDVSVETQLKEVSKYLLGNKDSSTT